MTEVPTTAWSKDFAEADALTAAPRFPAVKQNKWRRTAGVVRHVFTHFPLELTVYAVELSAKVAAPGGTRWVAFDDLSGEALPSLMRKVIAHVFPIDASMTSGVKRP